MDTHTRQHTPIEAQNDTHINAPLSAHGKCFGLIPAGGSWLDDLIDWTARQFRRADDAARMVACWNACKTIPTEDLERHYHAGGGIVAAAEERAMVGQLRVRRERDDAFHLLKQFAEEDQGAVDMLQGCGIDVTRTSGATVTRLKLAQDLLAGRGDVPASAHAPASVPAPGANDHDIKELLTYYRANTLTDLARLQARHVVRLLSKLPITEGQAALAFPRLTT